MSPENLNPELKVGTLNLEPFFLNSDIFLQLHLQSFEFVAEPKWQIQ